MDRPAAPRITGEPEATRMTMDGHENHAQGADMSAGPLLNEPVLSNLEPGSRAVITGLKGSAPALTAWDVSKSLRRPLGGKRGRC